MDREEYAGTQWACTVNTHRLGTKENVSDTEGGAGRGRPVVWKSGIVH